MKIVIAEKVAANAVQLLKDEADWTIVTPDPTRERSGSGAADLTH